jgi:hypothetical protein
MKHHLTHVRMAVLFSKIKKCQECGEMGNLVYCWWEWYSRDGKPYGNSSKS